MILKQILIKEFKVVAISLQIKLSENKLFWFKLHFEVLK